MKINVNKLKSVKFGTLGDKLSGQKSMWQKGLLLAAFVALSVFFFAMAYLFIRPLDGDMKALIDEEISSTNVTFDQKTLDSLNQRQQPAKNIAPVVGKNPFLPF